MATLEDVERRLQELETRLRRQRRLTAGLATLAVVGLLAALRPPEPEVLRARKLEIVDGEDRVVGGFGIGVGFSAAAGNDSGFRGWCLADPDAEVVAVTMIGEAEAPQQGGGAQAEEKLPFAMMSLQGGAGVAQLVASGGGVTAEFLCDDLRGVSLHAEHDRSRICIEAPSATAPEDEGGDVLRLEHTTGKPTIRGWDDAGEPTIDLE